jgi:hypothetical protein
VLVGVLTASPPMRGGEAENKGGSDKSAPLGVAGHRPQAERGAAPASEARPGIAGGRFRGARRRAGRLCWTARRGYPNVDASGDNVPCAVDNQWGRATLRRGGRVPLGARLPCGALRAKQAPLWRPTVPPSGGTGGRAKHEEERHRRQNETAKRALRRGGAAP